MEEKARYRELRDVVEPQPRAVAGTLNNALAEQIPAPDGQSGPVSPDVTRRNNIRARYWAPFVTHGCGTGNVLPTVACRGLAASRWRGVPFWRAMEPDYVPDGTRRTVQII
ncbi:hypothetical protein KCP69_19200 [Salmonella enterica subsp. enterica]|nr:hypothetical protein KCP69_19200 [Salmonella enterica subsp. enterica]